MAILSNINNLLRISNSTGRVLINSTNAIVSNSEVLTVGGRSSLKNDSSSVATLVIVNGDATANTFQPYMYFSDVGGNRAGFGVETSTASLKINAQASIIFSTGAASLSGTEKMRISSTGDILCNSDGGTDAFRIFNSSTGAGDIYLRVEKAYTSAAVGRAAGIILGSNAGNLGSTWTMEATSSLGYFGSADLAFTHNAGGTASRRVTIDYTGNVGIGTVSPAKKLDVARIATTFSGASTDEGAVIRLTNPSQWEVGYDGNGFLGGIEFYSGDDSENGPAVFGAIKQRMLTPYNDTAMCFFTSQSNGSLTERMRIASGGNVGIGEDSPGYKLHVNSATNNIVAIFENTETSAGIKIKNGSDSGYVSTIGDDRMTVGFDVNGGATNLCITPSGNVGIGYVLPAAKLEIYSTATFNSRTSGINVHRPGSYGQYGSFSYNSDTTYFSSTYSGNAAANYGAFIWEQFNNGTVGREAMRINTDGVIKFANTATSTGDAGSIAHYTNNYMYIRGGTGGLALGDDGFGVSIYLNNSNNIAFNTGGGTTKLSIASNGLITQTMDSTTSASTLWSQGVPSKDVWYTVFTYAQYDSVCFFAMVSFENDAGDGANQAAMFATSAGTAYGAAFGVQQISGGTGIEARRSSTSFQVRQTIGAYASSTRLNVRFISIN